MNRLVDKVRDKRKGRCGVIQVERERERVMGFCEERDWNGCSSSNSQNFRQVVNRSTGVKHENRNRSILWNNEVKRSTNTRDPKIVNSNCNDLTMSSFLHFTPCCKSTHSCGGLTRSIRCAPPGSISWLPRRSYIPTALLLRRS